MKKAIGILAIVSMAVAPAMALTWDFNDGTTQGWTLAHNPSNAVAANPAGVIPEPGDGTNCLYLPDQGYAYIYVTSTNSFRFEADICGARMDVNKLMAAGLGYRFTHNQNTLDPNTTTSPNDGLQAVNFWFEGRSPTSERMKFRDTYSMGGENTNMSVLKTNAPGQWGTWYNIVETGHATVLYNMETGNPGDLSDGEAGYLTVKWAALDYAPLASYPATNFWQAVPLVNNAMTGAPHEVNMLRLGGAYSWSQFYADNVTFIPEPVSLVLLALGSIPMLRRRR